MHLRSFKRSWYIAVTALVTLLVISCSSETGNNDLSVPDNQQEPTPTPVVNVEDGVTTVEVHLSPTEGEGQVGTAIFVSDGNTTTVNIEVSPASSEAQPIHIHAGVCTDVGTVIHALQNVVMGTSSTEISLPIESILSGEVLVNVHASYTDASTYTACGQLPSSIGS